MKLSFLRNKRKEDKYFLALDIGTEAIKALIFKRGSEKIIILGASLEYFDRYGVFDSRDFEVDVIKKAILKTVEKAQNQAGAKVNSILLGLSANILKGRAILQSLKRMDSKKIIEEKEGKEILQIILKEAQKKISRIYAAQVGILPEDLQFLDSKILEIKIDGYRVPALRRYQGEKLDFKILTIFLPKYYLKKVKEIIQEVGLKNTSIVHPVQGLVPFLAEKPNGIFLDIGGEVTQIFLAKEKLLEKIGEFEMGGRIFSQVLSERLGLREERAKILKERYSISPKNLGKGISLESQKRIKEILWPSLQSWIEALKNKLEEMDATLLLPSDIFIFGGGSLLPEIQEILKQSDWRGLSFIGRPKLKFIYPRDLRNIEDKTKKLKSPQEVPPLFLCNAPEIGVGECLE